MARLDAYQIRCFTIFAIIIKEQLLTWNAFVQAVRNRHQDENSYGSVASETYSLFAQAMLRRGEAVRLLY